MKLATFLAFWIATVTVATAQQLPAPVDDTAYGVIDLQEARLGQLLFYDPILSGNRETACATCHHPAFGTSDGVSLSFGDGGIGLGPDRRASTKNPPEERIPRNSLALFNLGATEFRVLFHDGRLEVDASRPGGIRTPMADDMAVGFASVLSAQTMFPVLSRDEMAGSFDENEIGRLIRQGIITGDGGAWDVLARRVADIPAYRDAFIATYPHIKGAEDIAFTDLSNAIAVFMAHEWRSDTAPFDAVLKGEAQFDGLAQEGFELFYGEGGCASCHSGPFLTDHQFYVMGAAQIGPGKSATFEDHTRDDGRFRVTGRAEDRFAFRTPSLRNVALTGPYGHAGGHTDLGAFISDHADPRSSILTYDAKQALLAPFAGDDFTIMNDTAEVTAIRDAVTTPAILLSQDNITAIVAFLQTLTDPISLTGRMGIPAAVPSGLVIPNPD